jgi:hypothetical protein
MTTTKRGRPSLTKGETMQTLSVSLSRRNLERLQEIAASLEAATQESTSLSAAIRVCIAKYRITRSK